MRLVGGVPDGDNNDYKTASAPVDRTANTPIGTLVNNPAAIAILDRYIPEFTHGGFLDLIRDTTLKRMQG